MASNFDDIIRRVLGMQEPMPDESQPFRGSELGPMIEDWLAQVPQSAQMNEGEMPPADEARAMTERLVGPSQLMPYIPEQNPYARGPIPNITPDVDAGDPRQPLRTGNSKYGSGIDI